jgi:hypothetical protein
MKAICWGAILLAGNAIAGENVYRNGPADQRTSSFFRLASVTNGVSNEWGDQVTLAGVGRTITEMSVYTFGDFAAPTGAEKIRIRLYANDGSQVGAPPKATPGTVLWDSGFLSMKAGWRAQRIVVPSVVVPNTFTWTASFSGTSGMPFNRAGLCYFGPPTIGESDNSLWRRNDDASPWSYVVSNWTNGSSAYGSLGAAFWADGGPTPAIFNNTESPTRAFRVTPTSEIGDDAVFEGDGRLVSAAAIEYVSEIPSPQGDERARVRIYSRNEANSFGAPLAVLYDSGAQPINAAIGGHFITVYPEVVLPDDVIWTIEFSGTTQTGTDKLTIPARTDPNPGASVPTFWYREASGLTSYWFGDPTYDPTTWPSTAEGFNNIIGNFSARFTTDIPATIVEHSGTPVVNPGSVFSGTHADLLASDDVRWVLNPGPVFSSFGFPVSVVFTHVLNDPAASTLRVALESRGSANNIRQEIEFWNFSTNVYDLKDVIAVTPFGGQPDLTRIVDVGNPANYVGPGNEVRVRARWKATSAVFAFPWSVSLDREYVSYRP